MTGKQPLPADQSADLLRRARAARGLTQEDLAERFPGGISVDTISNIERGRVRPRRHTLLGLLDALGMDEPERSAIFEAWRLPHAAPDKQAHDAELARHDDLPVPITRVVGREAEIETVRGLMLSDAVRIVTLTGPGGVGKTRLALACIEALRGSFAHGFSFVDLTGLRDPGQLLHTVALTLGLPDLGDRPVTERLIAHLRSQQAVLVLDNSETAVPASPLLVPLLEACSGLKLMATSREALRLRGEHEFPVAPLALPKPAHANDIEALANVPAVQFFVERASMVSASFALTEANAAAVIQICQRLDGLPLALELAAARLRHLHPDMLASRLDRALSVLVDGPRDLPERQRTLRATIGWSHALLSEDEQRVLRRLSVFVGGFTAGAATHICLEPGRDQDHDDFFAALDGLIDKNLVKLQHDDTSYELRYTMLETIREYAAERLQESGEEAAVRNRHARFFCDIAEASFREMYSARRGPWIATLKQEWGNVHSALSWSIEGNGEREIGLRLAGGLGRYWYFTGGVNEGRSWLARAMSSGARAGSPFVQARALYSTGKLAWVQGDYDTALEAAQEAINAAAEHHDDLMLGDSLTELGYTLVSLGRHQEAVEVYDEAVTINRRLGAQWELAFTLAMESQPLRILGETDRARDSAQASLSLFESLGDPWGKGVAKAMIAVLLMDIGQLLDAEATLKEIEGEFSQVPEERFGALQVLLMRGYFSLQTGNMSGAAIAFENGIVEASKLGHSPFTLAAIAGAGAVTGASGLHRAAAVLFGAASPLLSPSLYADDAGAGARALLSDFLPLLRNELGEQEADAAWEEGRRLPMDEACRLALASVMEASQRHAATGP